MKITAAFFAGLAASFAITAWGAKWLFGSLFETSQGFEKP